VVVGEQAVESARIRTHAPVSRPARPRSRVVIRPRAMMLTEPSIPLQQALPIRRAATEAPTGSNGSWTRGGRQGSDRCARLENRHSGQPPEPEINPRPSKSLKTRMVELVLSMPREGVQQVSREVRQAPWIRVGARPDESENSRPIGQARPPLGRRVRSPRGTRPFAAVGDGDACESSFKVVGVSSCRDRWGRSPGRGRSRGTHG
jgi:hypothetical protein